MHEILTNSNRRFVCIATLAFYVELFNKNMIDVNYFLRIKTKINHSIFVLKRLQNNH